MTDPVVPRPSPDARWEERVDALWAGLAPDTDGAWFRARMEALVAELGAGHPVAAFERGSACDSTGHPDQAVPLYEAALAGGLDGPRRRRATIQLASSLRALGEPERALALLATEAGQPSDELDDAVVMCTAFTLAALGREREALAITLTALAPHLPRYQRSTAAYAALLTETPDGPPADAEP
jgi:hypothetical protein